jgi:hypothetical protein
MKKLIKTALPVPEPSGEKIASLNLVLRYYINQLSTERFRESE